MNQLTSRREFSTKRFRELAGRVRDLPEVAGQEHLCIYATGSYGRNEASEFSDLDLFFVVAGSLEVNRVSQRTKTLMDAALIRLCEQLGFPPFTGDGEYLAIHYLANMERELGSPRDDYENHFTARLLLLMESQPVCNPAVYQRVLERIIATYYRDYEQHSDDFRAVFLVNDTLRFWKTLCLNYEHKRNHEEKRTLAKHRVKNLKLKFSRMLTCFSTIIPIAANLGVRPEELAALVTKTPWDRLQTLRNANVDKLKEQYEWFLGFTDRPEHELEQALDDRKHRDEAFGRADLFGKEMYELLLSVTTENQRRFLLI